MKASDIMITQVVKVLESDSIRTVLDKFVAYRIGGMPVVNHHNEIKGYISDGDIMREVGTQIAIVPDFLSFTSTWVDKQTLEDKYRLLIHTNVMEIASRNPITVDAAKPLEDVAAILGRKRIKKVIVEKNGGYLAGIISRGDMVRFLNGNCFRKLPG